MISEEKINILLVDDSPTNLLALESILRAQDRNLLRASCGDEALRYLLVNEAALVLLDVYMPGIDGLETADLIRRRKKSHDIPIIFLTANSTGVRHLTRGYSLGAVDYIVKPVEPDILRSKVAVFVDLFKKTREIKQQAELLREQNLQLENANLNRLNMLIDLGHELVAEHDPHQVLAKFCRSTQQIVDAEQVAVGLIDQNKNNMLLEYFSSRGPGNESRECRVSSELQPALDNIASTKRTLRLNEGEQFNAADTRLE